MLIILKKEGLSLVLVPRLILIFAWLVTVFGTCQGGNLCEGEILDAIRDHDWPLLIEYSNVKLFPLSFASHLMASYSKGTKPSPPSG